MPKSSALVKYASCTLLLYAIKYAANRAAISPTSPIAIQNSRVCGMGSGSGYKYSRLRQIAKRFRQLISLTHQIFLKYIGRGFCPKLLNIFLLSITKLACLPLFALLNLLLAPTYISQPHTENFCERRDEAREQRDDSA